jgi:predicted NBD/HSP70 family sugar kinase
MKSAAIPSSLRKINRRSILRHMVQVPAAARGELAQVAGTSAVTAGKIVDELLEEGVLETAEMRRGAIRPGRPGQNLRLNTRSPRFVLLHLGVRHTRMGFAALGTTEETPWAVEFETPASAREWESGLREAWNRIKLPSSADLWSVVMATPGIVDEQRGKVLFSPNIHWSEGVDFPSLLRDVCNLPVEMIQETRALAMGQRALSPNEKDFLLVDFGHGVAAAAVVGGSIYHGSLPHVVELGHTLVMENTRPCGCGSVGCVETLLSRRGLFASILEHGNKRTGTPRYSWSVVARHIAEHGLEPWLRKSLQAGAGAIAGALNIMGLGRVVISGSMHEMPQDVRAYFAAEIRKAAMWAKFGEVDIEYAPRRAIRGMISFGIERLVAGV